MSFSVNFVAPTKAEAKKRFVEQLDAAVGFQAAHKKDRAAIEVVTLAYIDHLDDNPEQDVAVNVYGSVMWDGAKYQDYNKAPDGLVGGNLTLNISLQPRV